MSYGIKRAPFLTTILAAAALVSAAGSAQAVDPKAWGQGSDNSIDDFTSGTFTPILQRGIAAPAAGVLLITGSLSMEDDNSLGGTGRLSYRLRLDSTPVFDNNFAYELSSSSASGNAADSGAISVVVPVTKGAHMVFLDAMETGSGSFIIGRALSIVYFPLGTGMPIPKGPSAAPAKQSQ